MARKSISPSQMQVVGYIRVSTDEQSLSVEAQHATLAGLVPGTAIAACSSV